MNCRYLKPYDELTLAAIVADHKQLLVVEEGTVVNGFGAYMASVVATMDPAVRVDRARRAGPHHLRGIACAAARVVRPRRGRHRGARARPARDRGGHGVMRIGVIGHQGYEGLSEILALLAVEAPRLGAGTVARADTPSGGAGRRAAHERRADSTRCFRSAATARCCVPRGSSAGPTCRSSA